MTRYIHVEAPRKKYRTFYLDGGRGYYEQGQEAVQHAGRAAKEYAQSGKEALREARESSHSRG